MNGISTVVYCVLCLILRHSYNYSYNLNNNNSGDLRYRVSSHACVFKNQCGVECACL